MQSLDRLLGMLGWVPTWLWVILAATAAGAALKYFGWRGALAALVGVVSIGAAANIRKQGWEAREKAGAKNVVDMVNKAREARKTVRNDVAANPGKLRDDDGYRRD